MDVAFVVDDTGSMGSAIGSVKTELASILGEIQAASGGDYRLALVTFKDDVTVSGTFADSNRVAIEPKILALTAFGGAGAPEASDEALKTVLNALPAAGRPQSGDFKPPYRATALKIAILVTDAPPGGFDDTYTVGVDDVSAHTQATDAAAKGIKISAIFVPTGGDYSGQRAIMQDYAAVTGGVFVETSPTGIGTGEAIRGIIAKCGSGVPECPGIGPLPEPSAGKVSICHRTGSANNPYVVIEVSESALKAHQDHGDTIFRRATSSKSASSKSA